MVTSGAQATFVVEYPCDQFCRIEVDLTRERGNLTLQQMWDKADAQHRPIHAPEEKEETPVATEDGRQRPATDLFRAAPSRGDDRRTQQRR